MISYRSTLNQCSEQIATFVSLCCLAIRKYTIVDVIDVLDDGVGTDDPAVDGCSAGKRSREQNSGKASKMHDEAIQGCHTSCRPDEAAVNRD